MKTTKLFLFIFLLSFITFQVFSATPTQSTEIELNGSSNPKGPSRVPAAPSIEVYQTGDLIAIYFLNDLGNITITITDEAGTVVYQTTELSGSGAIANIDLYGLESGSYAITFTNCTGFYKFGEFVL